MHALNALTKANHTATVSPSTSPSTRQVYLLDRDTGLLCRIAGLYAARGIDISALQYDHAAPSTMMLTIAAIADEEQLRVLVEKAGSFVGVIEAAMRPCDRR
jgi:acetolactate synthase small subunit